MFQRSGMFRSWLATAAVLLFAAPTTRAQDDWAVLPPDSAPRKMLSAYLLTEAQKHFDARRAEVAMLKSPEDVKQRQITLKARMLDALGGFPDKTALNARIVGKENRDGYRIEKIIYESRPQHHVTATLYLPDGTGPYPGCIMPIGHSSNGKAAEYIQRGSILLARNGIAVLAYDPIGQGERRQLLDDHIKAAVPSTTSEHTLIGIGALLIGTNTATYRIWDGIRSLDYLESRPEIDPKRLGCTGCSGGGTLTSYLMALDERIACAAPSCYITTLERLFATIGPQDAEQNITGQVALGIEHADYLTMRAPRPTLIATATRDFFDIGGSWTTFREATQIYGILGHAERVNLVEYNTVHGYPKPQREAVTRFMRRWLLHKDDAIIEPAFAIAQDIDLQCTRSGQVLEDFKGKSAFHLNTETEKKLAGQRAAKRATQSPEELRREVRRLIGLPDVIPAAKVRQIGTDTFRKGNLTYRKYVFETEPGMQVPALHFLSSKGKAAGLVMLMHGAGKAVAAGPGGLIEKEVAAGNEVLALDVRGFGETAPSPPAAKPGYFGSDFKETYLALHLNRPLLGQRVYDVLSVMAYLQGDQTAFRKDIVSLCGALNGGPIAMHAAIFEPRFVSVATHRSPQSWAAVVRTPINYDQLTNVVPWALKAYDLPDLARLMAPRALIVRAAVNPRLELLTQAELDTTYADVAKSANVRLYAGARK